MDRHICYLEAEGGMTTREIVRETKRRFPVLSQVSPSSDIVGTNLTNLSIQYVITSEAIARRVELLDLQDNDYFKAGTQVACASAARSGFPVPDFAPDIYLKKPVVSHQIEKIDTLQV